MNIITITFDELGKYTLDQPIRMQQGDHLTNQLKMVFHSSWGTITQVQVHALLPDEVTVTPNTVLTISSVGGEYWTYDVPSWFTVYSGQLKLAISCSYALVGDETPKRFSRVIPLQVDESVISDGAFTIDPIVEESILTSIADLTARVIVLENDMTDYEARFVAIETVNDTQDGRLDTIESNKVDNEAVDKVLDVSIGDSKRDASVKAGRNMVISSTVNRDDTVGGNYNVAVSGSKVEEVSGNEEHSVYGYREDYTAGYHSITAENYIDLLAPNVKANGQEIETQDNKGVANGYVPLNASTMIDSAYVPNSFDDVLEFATYADLVAYVTPTTSKLYIVIADETSGGNHSTYRYSGSIYVRVSDEMSASEVKTLYESNANTNAFTDSDESNLDTSYAHSQLADGSNPHATTFANIVSKPTTLAGYGITDAYDKDYIDNLADYNGWQQTLLTLTPLYNTDTIALSELNTKDRVMLICRNDATGEVDTDEIVGDMIVDGTKFVFFDNASVHLTVVGTTATFTDTVGDYALTIYALEVAPQEAVNIGYDGTGTNYLGSETEVQGAVSELDSVIKIIDTDLKKQDAIFEERLDSIEELTRKQTSDVASASDTSIISLGKDVAETPLRVQVDGLLLDAPQLATNGSDFTSGWTPIASTQSVSLGILTNTGNGTASNPRSYSSNILVPINTSLKVYFIAKARVTNSNALSIQVYTSASSGSNPATQNTPTINNWYILSGVNTISDNDGAIAVFVSNTYADAATANGKVMEVDYAYAFNLSTLIANKQYSPMFNTTFDLMTDANIKLQMDYWVADGTLPNNIQAVDMQKRVKSVGKNLFDKSKYGTSYAYKIKVKPSTAYVWNVSTAYKTYDKDLVEVQSGTATSLTTSANVFYIAFSGIANLDTFQLELGTVATTYTPYRSSELYLNGNSKGYKLPNGVMDTIEMRNGKAYRVQRVAKYTLQAVDIAAIENVNGTQLAYTSTNFLVGLGGTYFKTQGNAYIGNKLRCDYVDIAVGYENQFYISSTYRLGFVNTLGTYASLAAAQSALAGTVIYYQLATPIETEISAIGNAMAYPNGTVYVEPATSDFGIYGTNLTISNSNYPILAFDEIYKLNADGSSTKLANSGATISGDKLSFTHSSLSAGDSVWFSYYYYSSTPNIMGRTTVYYYEAEDDLRFPATRLMLGATNKPDFDYTNIGLLFPQNDPTEAVYIIAQLPHDRVVDSPLEPHVHCRLTKAGQPVFKIDYKIYNPNGSTVPTSFTTYTMNSNTATWSSGTISNMVYGASEISGVGYGDSAIMIIKLYRDDNVYVGDILVDEFDIHYVRRLN